MRMDTLEAVFQALNRMGVRYLVVGGVAVNVHGYQRATQDLDLVVHLRYDNALRAIEVLTELGYRPVLPVRPEDFADADRRREWHETRNLEVFSMTSDQHGDTTIDLFVHEPFAFEEERKAAFVAEVAPGLEVPFVRLSTLIAMKEAIGRARDQDDIEHLRWILESREGRQEDPS